jgi:hypothetical protein
MSPHRLHAPGIRVLLVALTGCGGWRDDAERCLLTRSEYDDGDDGTVEHVDAFDYDDQGRLVVESQDHEGDGVVDVRYLSTWSDDDLLVVWETDEGADGSVESRFTYTYDDRGRLVLQEYDPDADGSPYSCVYYSWTDDDQEEEVVVDVGCDGDAEVRTSYSYYEDGSLAGYESDTDGDGVIDERVTNVWVPPPEVTWSADGLVETEAWDYGDDGSIDRIEVRTYDAEGRLLRVEVDNGADGILDEWQEVTWGDDGSREVVWAVDLAGNQTFFWVRTCSYSAEGWLTREVEVFDLSWHGGSRQERVTTYTLNAYGRVEVLLETYDSDSDGVIDTALRMTSTWDCAG